MSESKALSKGTRADRRSKGYVADSVTCWPACMSESSWLSCSLSWPIALAELAPDVIVPAHCTGWRAIHALAAAFPGAFIQNSVGTRFEM